MEKIFFLTEVEKNLFFTEEEKNFFLTQEENNYFLQLDPIRANIYKDKFSNWSH